MKKWLFLIVSVLMIFGTSLTCFASTVYNYNNLPSYIQFHEAERFTFKNPVTGDVTSYIYVVDNGDSISFIGPNGYEPYGYSEGGDYRFNGNITVSTQYSDSGNTIVTYGVGQAFNYFWQLPGFDNLRKGSGKNVYAISKDATSFNSAVDFFPNPLLEMVKVQQGKTTEVMKQVVSYLEFLVPWAIGLVACLIGASLLPKVLHKFL